MDLKAMHTTANLKVAAMLATIGAEVVSSDVVIRDGKQELNVTLEDDAKGITCGKAVRLWMNRENTPLEDLVDDIIERRGITPEEYAILQVETSRAVLGNRGVLLKCGMNQRPMISKTLKSGRQISYREGTPESEIRKALNH
jgi:hypothetical protein